MQITKLIEYLEGVKAEHGEIEVFCVTPGMASAWEIGDPGPEINALVDCDLYYPGEWQREHGPLSKAKRLIIGLEG